MKKFIKKILAVCVSAAMAASMAAVSVVAEERENHGIQYLSEDYGITPRGATLPSTSTYWTLSNGDYSGKIEEFSYSIYTNYWFTGSSSIYVSLSGSNLYDYFKNTNPSLTRTVKLTLLKKKTWGTEEVGSVKATSQNPVSVLSKTFSNLDKDAKYIVLVEKSNDGISIEDLDIDVI